MLAGRGLTFRTWSVVDMEFPESVDAAEGWLISGSKHGAYEDVPFIAPLEDFIRQAYERGIPLVGICFGHQIIAQALGGKVEKFSGGWTLGRQIYGIDGQECPLNAWHQDQVTGLSYKGRAFSVQPHPEFSPDEVRLLLDVRRAALDEKQAETVRANLDKPLANEALADRIAAFFKEPAHV